MGPSAQREETECAGSSPARGSILRSRSEKHSRLPLRPRLRRSAGRWGELQPDRDLARPLPILQDVEA